MRRIKKEHVRAMYCPHCISHQRYAIATDNISTNNQNSLDLFLYTSLQHEKNPRANSIAILIYSTDTIAFRCQYRNRMDN